jgi:hypothetical protein
VFASILRVSSRDGSRRSHRHGPNEKEDDHMPLIQVRVIKDVFSKEQKRQIIGKLTDAMV